MTFWQREGHCNVLQRYEEGDFALGGWVGRQRNNKDDLSLARIQRLDDIGFDWDPRVSRWEEGFAALKAYWQREGHCNGPTAHKEGGFKLVRWVDVQRTSKDSLSTERRQRLDGMGFVWNAVSVKREEGFAALVTFWQREGHCNVPRPHKEGEFKLGRWAANQRQRKDGLSTDRRQRLDGIGFVWNTKSES